MTEKRFHRIIVALLAACTLALTQTSCNKIKEIAPTSFELESVKPNGMRSLTVFAAIGIHNPTLAFQVSGIEATLKHNSVELGTLTVDPFSVKKKSDDIHHIRGVINIADKVSLFQVAAIAGSKTKLNECKIDVVATVSAAGFTKVINKTDIPLSDLMGGVGSNSEKAK